MSVDLEDSIIGTSSHRFAEMSKCFRQFNVASVKNASIHAMNITHHKNRWLFISQKNVIDYCIKICVQDYMCRGDEWPSLWLASGDRLTGPRAYQSQNWPWSWGSAAFPAFLRTCVHVVRCWGYSPVAMSEVCEIFGFFLALWEIHGPIAPLLTGTKISPGVFVTAVQRIHLDAKNGTCSYVLVCIT